MGGRREDVARCAHAQQLRQLRARASVSCAPLPGHHAPAGCRLPAGASGSAAQRWLGAHAPCVHERAQARGTECGATGEAEGRFQ
eukprot:366573-Chlamydomonas_euryale.AAC.52